MPYFLGSRTTQYGQSPWPSLCRRTPHGQLTPGITHHGQMEGEPSDGQSSEWGISFSHTLPSPPLHHANSMGKWLGTVAVMAAASVCVWKWDPPIHCCLPAPSTMLSSQASLPWKGKGVATVGCVKMGYPWLPLPPHHLLYPLPPPFQASSTQSSATAVAVAMVGCENGKPPAATATLCSTHTLTHPTIGFPFGCLRQVVLRWFGSGELAEVTWWWWTGAASCPFCISYC